ncbi:MAG: hypothetical protein CEN89_526 [Candidatus Berkelbacteria bacterium Licking1014_7]|uniref:Uncharacterized protein n=1 Tax=Candidatus Berkelbacteria bacterium Licking1014_7 TaxID=2017147 RepID=A0A554LJ72_9BACT|nr:MAG: hypothetical protein CEN89_526 [Candidatus Berkelbacteria bacterium Licking1014_7]
MVIRFWKLSHLRNLLEAKMKTLPKYSKAQYEVWDWKRKEVYWAVAELVKNRLEKAKNV